MFEVDASCLGVEVDVGVGVADLVLEGSDKRSIIIEIKVHADDSTIGQISRISEGYLAKERIDPKNVRKVIICVTYGKTLVEACLGANIELYKLGFHRII
jgi:RecB family endonuclease NucS